MTDIIKTRNTAYDELSQRGTVQGNELPQQNLLAIVWHRRWIVALSVILSLVGAFAYLLQAVPVYTSVSRLYVERSGPKILNDSQGMTGKAESFLYTQAELLKSTPIIAKAVDTAEARKMRSFDGMDNLVGYLKKSVIVEVGKKDDIISVSLDSPYPEEAALMVNTLVDSFITYQGEHNKSTASEVLRILQKEKEKREAELAVQRDTVMEFKRANPEIVADNEKGNMFTDRTMKVFDALVDAQLQVLDAKANLESAKSMAKDPAQLKKLLKTKRYAMGAYEGNENQDTELLLTKLQLQLAVSSGKGADHPDRRMLDSAIASAKQEIETQNIAFANAYVESAEQALEAAKGKEAEVLKSYEEQQKLAMDLNIRVAEFATMSADLQRATKLCDVLDDRIKELSVTEDSGALNISILEVARAEPQPTKPQKARIMAMALALGLMMGMGLALLRDWTDQRLRSPEEISALLDCPVLGVVPHMTDKNTLPERGQCVRLEQKSDVAEAYRTIRTAVYFGIPAGKAKTLLVTSPAPGDGKSTMISNLATAMAQAGQRVLIIDGDFRRPTQHKIFEADDEVGLSTVMCGRATVQEAIAHTALKNLDLLVCGPIPPNPSELLNSQEFGDLIKQLSEQYDHILIDSPPVMPVTDARILGALCDVSILVLRAEKSTRKASQMALEGLLSVGANILGVVVNDVSRNRGRYGYYSGYGYYSYGYYGHDDNGNGNGHGRRAKALTHTPARTAEHEESEA